MIGSCSEYSLPSYQHVARDSATISLPAGTLCGIVSESNPDDTYLNPYREAIQRFGPSFKATLWGAEETQRLRFDVIADLAAFGDCHIVDAGCGRGDLAQYLHQRSILFRKYTGIDAMEEMINVARERELPRCDFQVADIVSDPMLLVDLKPDFVCFSGTLNTMEETTARDLVRVAYDASAQGVVFNFLSDRFHARWADSDLTPAHRFNTLSWLDWAMSLSSRVSFTQSYLDGHDATILILHDDR